MTKLDVEDREPGRNPTGVDADSIAHRDGSLSADMLADWPRRRARRWGRLDQPKTRLPREHPLRQSGEAVTPQSLAALREALEAEGFIDLTSPNGGLFFSVEYLSRTSLAELLETMVTRREKIDRSFAQLGEVARVNYADTVAVVNAVKRVIDDLDRVIP